MQRVREKQPVQQGLTEQVVAGERQLAIIMAVGWQVQQGQQRGRAWQLPLRLLWLQLQFRQRQPWS